MVMLDLSNRSNCFYWQTDRELAVADFDHYFLKRQKISSESIEKLLRNGITSISPITELIVHEPDSNVLKGNVNVVRKVTINEVLYVVRLHPKGIKNGYFYVEKEALESARANGLPVPKILEVHQATDEHDLDFVLMTASAGNTMEREIEDDSQVEHSLLRQSGQLMAYIHQINVEKFGSFDNTIAKETGALVGLHDTNRDFIFCGLEENIERLVSFAVIDQETAEQFREIFADTQFVMTEPRLVHNDFADWNILVDEGKISAILDWDECHGGDPVADLACWSTFFDMNRYAELRKGYETVAELPDDYEERFHYYRLRYTISKMALRVKRAQVDDSQFIKDKIAVGTEALQEELEWFI